MLSRLACHTIQVTRSPDDTSVAWLILASGAGKNTAKTLIDKNIGRNWTYIRNIANTTSRNTLILLQEAAHRVKREGIVVNEENRGESHFTAGLSLAIAQSDDDNTAFLQVLGTGIVRFKSDHVRQLSDGFADAWRHKTSTNPNATVIAEGKKR